MGINRHQPEAAKRQIMADHAARQHHLAQLQYMTKWQVAELLGIDRHTLLEREKVGNAPPSHRMGHRTPVYARDEVDAWLHELPPEPC